MLNPDLYKPTSPMKGVWLFFISKARYVSAAVEHACWLNLQATDLRQEFLNGQYSLDLDAIKDLELKRYDSLRHQFRNAFFQVAVTSVIALLVGLVLGYINSDFPFQLGKVFSFCGTFLATWAALFELGGLGLASWDGETLSETVHPSIFQVLFIPGTFAIMCSILA